MVNNATVALSNKQPFQLKSSAHKSFFTTLTKILAFALLFLVSTGYESANPSIDYTKTEFYTQEIRTLLKDEYKKSFLTAINDSSKDQVLNRLTMDFFSSRAFLPAWTLNFNTNKYFAEGLENMANAKYKGLDSRFYNLENIARLQFELNTQISNDEKLFARQNLEIAFTKSIIKYMIHMGGGINNSDTSEFYHNFLNSIPRVLNYALANENLNAIIEQVQPSFYQYKTLCNALTKYLDNTKIDTIHIFSDSNFATKKIIAEKLVQSNFLSSENMYDSVAFIGAVKNFQKFHGLKATGILEKRTLKHLAKSTSFRFLQIALNLDRIRKMVVTDSNCIFVNIPEYKLMVIENGSVQSVYNVMVGESSTPTPEISSEIRSIIANPYWTVPPSITFKELLPKIKNDSNYLVRNGFKVIDSQNNAVEPKSINWQEVGKDNFDYRIRQDLGSSNALGNVKFHFPNGHGIFIHDTQSKKLFNSDIRAFSHGCIRLQDPERLADYLINKYAGNEDRNISVLALIKKRTHKNIALKYAMPIHLKYLTCSADEEGNIYFYTDIYKRDEAEINQLFSHSMPM